VINAGGYVLQPSFVRLSHDPEPFRTALCRALRWLCIYSHGLVVGLTLVAVEALLRVAFYPGLMTLLAPLHIPRTSSYK
jgi:hypothetical protein